MARGIKTGGRAKGTPNKRTERIREIVDEVFSRVDVVERFERWVNDSDPNVALRATALLLEYGFSKPKAEGTIATASYTLFADVPQPKS